MKKKLTACLFASFITMSSLADLAQAQFGGNQGGSFGSGGFGSNTGGGTGGFGSGGFGTGGTGTGNSGGFGSGSGSSTTFGNNSSGSLFQPTTSSFGNLSYGRTPFGTESNLRGPTTTATGAMGGTSRTRTTGTAATGLSGLGGLGALGIGGLGRNNRNTNLNQNANNQNAVRTRISASNMRAEIDAPAVPATQIMARIGRLPNAERYKNAQVTIQGETAIISAANLPVADLEKLQRFVMLEPGINDVRIDGAASAAAASN